ncbi:hypothetical protein BGZ65_007321 [Modicella reniformis]|uniref:Tafazzin family protein n=1 Tax=Modicella reniformis TaxID=1440133 RepID=A0A9P6MKB3_9FUNG|nr:hypothetical protein BGZ65_007321 [Modicella reniformis]
MRGFWTQFSSSSVPTNNTPAGDDTDSVSVKPAPAPARALSTPFPIKDATKTTGQYDSSTTTTGDDKDRISSSQTSSPKLEPSPLPDLPFIPPPDQNPDLKGLSIFNADPSSLLLQYPRSNIERVQDFYQMYNPPERGWWDVASAMVMCGVGVVSKIFMTFGAYTEVHNLNPFLKILFDPHRTRPILTVTNHASTADDPLIWGALPWKCHLDPTRTIRYTLGAQELCYPNKLVSAFFRFGQTVPTIRGIGIYQPAIDKSIDLLRTGRWVHIFPEGKINQTDQLIRLKWGVGRILMEYGGPPVAEGGKSMNEVEMPIVIPIYHLGMENILRLYEDNSSPVFPRLGMPLTIVFGEPIDFGSLMKEYKEGKIQEVEARVKITERVFEAMDELKNVAHRWRPQDVDFTSRYRDTTVKIEEL